MLMPGKDPGSPPVSLGGESLPWSITSSSKHPDVAAAYIDFLTDANAARVLVQTDNLPAMPTDAQPDSALSRDVFAAWQRLNGAEGLVPYLDYSTPDFYDQITAAIQRLLGGKVSPQAFTQGVQSDYATFTKTL
jgi:raffinose/stachyose/melibiose transport system substrate-binding protein